MSALPGVTVAVPTYGRPRELARCLAGIAAQTRPPDALFIVACAADPGLSAIAAAAAPSGARIIVITQRSQVAALNAALDAARTEIIAFTDDDAVPRHGWVAAIAAHFAADTALAGLGGRDITHDPGMPAAVLRRDVGRIQWFGREICNHHLGSGPCRPVDTLKGANMAFRLAAIGTLRFDTRLIGRGAEPRNDTAFCLALRRRGCRLLYDPALAVDHYPAAKPAGERTLFDAETLRMESHNATLVMLEHLRPALRPVFLVWAVLVGTRAECGLLQGLRFARRDGIIALRRVIAAWRGRFGGLRDWQASRGAAR